MHGKNQRITAKKTAGLWNKLLLAGIVSVFFLGITGCGKKETVLFLEEAVTGTEEETASAGENKTAEEAMVSQEEMTEQTESGSISASCFVHICGAVKRPGVYELPEGSRIFEAVELAGGLTEEACGEYQNQAEKITDGMKIYIPTAEELEDEENGETFWKEETKETEETKDTKGVVNINTADKELLMTLPGIGESRAESIVSYREEYGSFKTIEDIMQVSGIKQGAYEKLKDKICID